MNKNKQRKRYNRGMRIDYTQGGRVGYQTGGTGEDERDIGKSDEAAAADQEAFRKQYEQNNPPPSGGGFILSIPPSPRLHVIISAPSLTMVENLNAVLGI